MKNRLLLCIRARLICSLARPSHPSEARSRNFAESHAVNLIAFGQSVRSSPTGDEGRPDGCAPERISPAQQGEETPDLSRFIYCIIGLTRFSEIRSGKVRASLILGKLSAASKRNRLFRGLGLRENVIIPDRSSPKAPQTPCP